MPQDSIVKVCHWYRRDTLFEARPQKSEIEKSFSFRMEARTCQYFSAHPSTSILKYHPTFNPLDVLTTVDFLTATAAFTFQLRSCSEWWLIYVDVKEGGGMNIGEEE